MHAGVPRPPADRTLSGRPEHGQASISSSGKTPDAPVVSWPRMQSMEDTAGATERNVVILGSGPAGLTAALYAARANLQPLVLKGVDAGGQLMLTTEVENYPGFPDAILGPELMDAMEKQAARFDTELLHQAATSVDLSRRPFRIASGDEEWLRGTTTLATGASAKMRGL